VGSRHGPRHYYWEVVIKAQQGLLSITDLAVLARDRSPQRL